MSCGNICSFMPPTFHYFVVNINISQKEALLHGISSYIEQKAKIFGVEICWWVEKFDFISNKNILLIKLNSLVIKSKFAWKLCNKFNFHAKKSSIRTLCMLINNNSWPNFFIRTSNNKNRQMHTILLFSRNLWFFFIIWATQIELWKNSLIINLKNRSPFHLKLITRTFFFICHF